MTQETRGGRPRNEQIDQAILKAAIDLVLEIGFRAVTIEAIAARTGVGKTTIYRRWPNKAIVIMEAFMQRVGSETLFPPAAKATESIRLQMRAMARVFRGKDGALVKALVAEAQVCAEFAPIFRERWTLPRRKLALGLFKEAVRRGEIRPDLDLEATVDLLYAPLYYRLQMATGPLSDAYIDTIFEHTINGLRPTRP
jgi:AcrR family transcriptional regulator